MRKLKNNSPSPPSNEQAHFLLRPLRKVYLQQPVTVSFSPQTTTLESSEKNPKQNQVGNDQKPHMLSATPRFNPDRRHYTPCFVIPCIPEEDSLMLSSHQIKLKESEQEVNQSEILIPKPRKRTSSYCSVCRSSYDDYLEHILSQNHKRSARDTLFSKYIDDLVRQIKKMKSQDQESLGVVTRSAKRRMTFEDPQEAEMVCKPRKRRAAHVKQNFQSESKIGRGRSKTKKQQDANEKDLRQTMSTILKSEEIIID